MADWTRSDIIPARMNSLVKKGLLCPRTEAEEWKIPRDECPPSPPPEYIVSFAPFHERGLAAPPHYFLRGLLHYYRIELQHLNPNGIQQISAFVALCEGYLGCEPHFDLWRYFFTCVLQAKRGMGAAVPIGCASIQPRSHRNYMKIPLSVSNKGWHVEWFYLRNDFGSASFPPYTGRVIKVRPHQWPYGPPKKEQKRFEALHSALHRLVANGLTGAGVIGAYHKRRVAPLMARALRLDQMTPGADLAGTVLASEVPRDSEVRQRLRKTLESDDFEFPDPGHPPMLLDEGFVDVSDLRHFRSSRPPLPEDSIQKEANRALGEEEKQEPTSGRPGQEGQEDTGEIRA